MATIIDTPFCPPLQSTFNRTIVASTVNPVNPRQSSLLSLSIYITHLDYFLEITVLTFFNRSYYCLAII